MKCHPMRWLSCYVRENALLEHITIKNFQSLKDVDIPLAKFTVIVGESSSGKSAILRAINAVASNALASDNITQGAKYSAVSIKTEHGTATIERKVGGSSAYKVTQVGSKESSFTSVNRQVPSQVTEVLGIAPNTKEVRSINFSGQHDPPYLLKDGASTVARVLGELTNVSTIFEAVKEASRRAKAANTIINVRRKDLDKIVTQISSYAEVAQEAKDITQAEAILAEAQVLDNDIAVLTKLVSRLESAEQLLESFIETSEAPDVAGMLQAQENFNKFVSRLRRLAELSKTIDAGAALVKSATSDILHAEEALHQTLVNAGTCPLCNREFENE
jgi:DNA repair exonuclease SbcCD ATPase subunit